MERLPISEISEGIECRIEGKVVRTFEAYDSFMATVLDDTGKAIISSEAPFSLGSIVFARGLVSRRAGILGLAVQESGFLQEGQEEFSRRIEAFVDSKTRPVEAQPIINDGIMKGLKPAIEEAARRILRARFLLRPIILRYHSDADGICAGLALHESLGKCEGRFLSVQNAHSIYDLSDAFRDINSVRSFAESAGPPLLILADLGSSPESVDAFGVVRGTGFETLVIDHHPISQTVFESIDFVLSPMIAGATSYYTAGLLAGEVGKAMGGPDPSELQRISLAGDKSGLAGPNPDASRKALALDYLGRYSKFQNTLEFYGSALRNEGMLSSIHSQANAKMKAAARIAKESLKVKELQNGFRLCTVDLQRAFKPGSFPGKGALCGEIHDGMSAEMNGPLVTIGYSGRLISIRANGEARERGFDANEIINSIRRELVNAIESGGGHDVAASVHVYDGFESIFLEELVRHIGEL